MRRDCVSPAMVESMHADQKQGRHKMSIEKTIKKELPFGHSNGKKRIRKR